MWPRFQDAPESVISQASYDSANIYSAKVCIDVREVSCTESYLPAGTLAFYQNDL